jgi:hypothetical protein
MKSAKLRRLRAPAAMIVGGAGLAAAVVVARGWKSAIGVVLIVVIAAVGYYIVGGRDSDFGAMIGREVDERQKLLRTRAQALAGVAVAFTAVIGYTVAIALRDPVWPFALFAGVDVAAFITGLVIFGAHGPLGNRRTTAHVQTSAVRLTGQSPDSRTKPGSLA